MNRLAHRHTRTIAIAILTLAAGLACSASALAQATPVADPVPATTTSTTTAKAAAAAPQPDLPIHRITLYRSGVGFFERSGLIDNNAEVQLRFNTEQINDILKSMVIIDRDGGSIESVSYGSKEPLSKRLASFGINIAANPSLPDLLSQLRGAPVKVVIAGADITGTVLGIEQRPSSPSKDAPAVMMPFLNLVTASGLRSVAVADISTFEILDKDLAGELNKALAALAEYRADRTKTVDIRFAGAGSRHVTVGYVHEMPVWKASYRLVLPDIDPPAETKTDDAAKTKGQLVMHGWAIVENTTDQDWNNVDLSLVSGRPVSFQMDLYEPLFAARPMVAVPTVPGVAPRIFALGIDNEEMAKQLDAGRSVNGITMNSMQSQASPAAPSVGGLMARKALASHMEAKVPQEVSKDQAFYGLQQLDNDGLTSYSPRAAAQAGTVGELFQFQVSSPISIERQRSAMIPIINANVTGRRVSIFNAADGSQFPMRGVEITNDSDLQLLPGPISVFDSGAYAGDAQIGQIPKNDKRLLAYALDLDVAVLTKPEYDSSVMKISIVDGMIRQTLKERRKMTYEFANKDVKRGRTIIVEHPKASGFELFETDKPTEQAQDLYRFTVPVEAGKVKKFTVGLEQTRFDSIAVTSFDMGTAISYRQAGKLSEKVLDALKQVAAKQAAINTTDTEIAQYNQQTAEIGTEQTRIRENMNRIEHTSDLYKRYMGKLTDQETQLENIKEKRDKAQAKVTAQRGELNDYIRGLNVE